MMLIGLVLALSVFAMGILGNEGLGWFASNDKVTANDMGISVNGDFNIIEGVEYFAIESISLDGVNNIYSFKNELPESEPKSLGQFSTLVAERQILIKITLHEGVGAVRVFASSSAEEYIADDTPSITRDNNSLSSIVEFYSVSGDSVDTANGEYVISSENFQGGASRFADVNVSGGSVTSSFTPYILVYETESGVKDNVVYIIVDYYEDAAEHVMDTASMLEANGEITFDGNEDDHVITFAPDFKILVEKVA